MIEIKYPNKELALEDQEEVVLLAQCIFGEARNQSYETMLAVGCVVRNRVMSEDFPRILGGGTWKRALLTLRQFSCFDERDPNRKKLMNPLNYESERTWKECYLAADDIMNNKVADNTNSADHYYSTNIKKAPLWAKEKYFTIQHGNLKFYNVYLDRKI